jgi:Excreted virulence factor EspC, type VII ESX diderm
MSDGTLGLTSSYIRELSDIQNSAKTYIELASEVTDGVSMSMLANHGSICSPSIAALAMANSAREAACTAMASVSEDLSEKLKVSAFQYDQTDAEGGGKLGGEMHPR